jgi:protease YdgD
MRVSALLAWLVILVSASPALSQERDRLDNRGELLGWEGVGRLDLGRGTCTGTLIARDLVLTAAHCVVDDRTGRILPKGPMRFHAGYTHGHTAASRGVTKVVVADGYTVDPKASMTQKVRTDLALLRLDSEIFSTEAEPFKVHSRELSNGRVTLVSYGRGRNQSLQRESGCRHKETYRGGLMTFDCDVTFGSSGAPVFTREEGRLRIVSVISMMSNVPGQDKEAIGMSLPSVVADMKRNMRNAGSRAPVSAGAKRITIGERSAGGARFVKPDR